MHQECGKLLECCDIQFRNKAALREHVMLFHRSGYKCRYCGRNFCRKALLKRHLATHGGQRDYICSICDYTTSQKANLDKHRRIHSIETGVEEEEEEEEEEDIDRDEEINARIIQAQQDFYNFLYVTSATPPLYTGHFRPHRFALPHRIKYTHEQVPCHEQVPAHDKVPAHEQAPSQETVSPHRAAYPEKAEEKMSSAGRQGVVDLDSYPDDDLEITRETTRRLFARPYKCSECTHTFTSQIDLRVHNAECRKPNPEPQRPLKYMPGHEKEVKVAVEDGGSDSDIPMDYSIRGRSENGGRGDEVLQNEEREGQDEPDNEMRQNGEKLENDGRDNNMLQNDKDTNKHGQNNDVLQNEIDTNKRPNQPDEEISSSTLPHPHTSEHSTHHQPSETVPHSQPSESSHMSSLRHDLVHDLTVTKPRDVTATSAHQSDRRYHWWSAGDVTPCRPTAGLTSDYHLMYMRDKLREMSRYPEDLTVEAGRARHEWGMTRPDEMNAEDLSVRRGCRQGEDPGGEDARMDTTLPLKKRYATPTHPIHIHID